MLEQKNVKHAKSLTQLSHTLSLSAYIHLIQDFMQMYRGVSHTSTRQTLSPMTLAIPFIPLNNQFYRKYAQKLCTRKSYRFIKSCQIKHFCCWKNYLNGPRFWYKYSRLECFFRLFMRNELLIDFLVVVVLMLRLFKIVSYSNAPLTNGGGRHCVCVCHCDRHKREEKKTPYMLPLSGIARAHRLCDRIWGGNDSVQLNSNCECGFTLHI